MTTPGFTFTHNLKSILSNSLIIKSHLDFSLSLKSRSQKCHKAILSQFSTFMTRLFSKGDDSYELPDTLDGSISDLSSIINSLYGEPLHVTGQNVFQIHEIAKHLGITQLTDFCKQVHVTLKPADFLVKSSVVLSSLNDDQFKNHTIVYKNSKIKMEKFLLASVSQYFNTKFALDDSSTSDFSQYFNIDFQIFIEFFNSFYSGTLSISLDSIFEFSHLSFYFTLTNLYKYCLETIKNSKPHRDWIFPALLKAEIEQNFEFINILSNQMTNIHDLNNWNPLALSLDAFGYFNQEINPQWLFKSICSSILNSTENLNPCEFSKLMQKYSLQELSIDFIASTIEPLIEKSEMLDVIADFLVPIMTKDPVLFSSKLYLLLLKQADETNNNKVIHEMLACVDGVLTAEKWNKREEQISLKFETLALFAKVATSEHLILWTIETLVKSWSDSLLSVDDFSTTLLSLNVSCCDPLLVYSSLVHLDTDPQLEQLIYRFSYKELLPTMVVRIHQLMYCTDASSPNTPPPTFIFPHSIIQQQISVGNEYLDEPCVLETSPELPTIVLTTPALCNVSDTDSVCAASNVEDESMSSIEARTVSDYDFADDYFDDESVDVTNLGFAQTVQRQRCTYKKSRKQQLHRVKKRAGRHS
ncbi:hypothetical protein RCL1_002960 [Eukaryota sp. TZLM3-RCL]